MVKGVFDVRIFHGCVCWIVLALGCDSTAESNTRADATVDAGAQRCSSPAAMEYMKQVFATWQFENADFLRISTSSVQPGLHGGDCTAHANVEIERLPRLESTFPIFAHRVVAPNVSIEFDVGGGSGFEAHGEEISSDGGVGQSCSLRGGYRSDAGWWVSSECGVIEDFEFPARIEPSATNPGAYSDAGQG
jgi:hypothetical protein